MWCGHADCEVAEHVGPVEALAHRGGEDDIESGGSGYEECDDACEL